VVIKNKDGSIVVDKLPGFRSGVIGKHYSNIEDLLQTLSNIRFVYYHDTEEYSHINSDFGG
jgi:hypothetical protein